MSIQSDYTVGLGKESVYGQPVAPTRFFEADSTLKESITTVQGSGMRPGQRVARASRRAVVKRESAGDITLDTMSVGLGYLLGAFFGSTTTTAIGATAALQQVHTLKATDFADSYTIQQGIPRLGSDTTDAYTYAGAQCGSLDIEAKADSIVSVKTSWIARSLSLEQAYAAPSYPADVDLFTFVHGRVAIGGAAFTAPTTTAIASAGPALAEIRDVSVSLKNNLDAGGFNLGGAGRRSRPAALAGGKDDAVTGSFTAEYTGRDFVDAYLDQEDLSLVLTFEGPTIATDVRALLQIAVPLARLDGDLPTGNGGDVITVSHPFKGYTPEAGQPVYAVYRSLDTAP
ncbi:phage tail tube protein [Cellulomonas timonensis]|uniref:phage tail tube protein n=1 Tax=Cellulomonas timonensis TaxID=1689271 RepID=UPI0008312D9B|nr:phage tail tube protein [Cellulomonas timonensis]